MKSRLVIGFTLISMVAPVLRAEDAPAAPKKPWKSVTELSVVSSNGNTKSQSAAGKETFTYDWSKTTMELIGAGYSAKDKGSNTAERYLASEKLSYKLSDRNYAFEKFEWSKDRFSGIQNRYDSTAGFGRDLVKSKKNLLLAELGGGYLKEERISEEDKGFATGRAYSKYVRTLSETSNFSQDAEYVQSFDDSEDFRVKTESSVTAAIDSHFALKLSYIWRHSQKPPTGFGRNDTILTVALVGTY